MKEHIIKCYTNQKLKLTIKCYIRDDIFVEQLKNGVIYYDTGLNDGNFEIINLNNFDKVVIENEQYYAKILGSESDEQEKIKHLEKIINQHENNIEQLKTCNNDYYNMICTLSSKISLINKFINEEKNLIPLHIKDYINKIITDKTIKLGDYIDETLEISNNRI